MKPRDRVRMALNHQQPDRTPMYLSWVPEFRNRLARVFETDLMGSTQYGGGRSYDLERFLGSDVLVVPHQHDPDPTADTQAEQQPG